MVVAVVVAMSMRFWRNVAIVGGAGLPAIAVGEFTFMAIAWSESAPQGGVPWEALASLADVLLLVVGPLWASIAAIVAVASLLLALRSRAVLCEVTAPMLLSGAVALALPLLENRAAQAWV